MSKKNDQNAKDFISGPKVDLCSYFYLLAIGINKLSVKFKIWRKSKENFLTFNLYFIYSLRQTGK